MVRIPRLATPFLTAALLATPLATGAQSLTLGALAGVARDSAGAPIAGALVTVSEHDGGVVRSVETGEGGAFSTRLLPPGSYDVLVERIGYHTIRITGIPVTPGAPARVDATLATGDAVRVEALVFHAGVRGGFGAPGRLGFAAGDLSALPAERRELGTVAGFSSLLSPGTELFGARRVMADGAPFRFVTLPAGVPDPLGSAAFSWRFLERAEVLAAPVDVEWGGAPAATLHALTRRGGRAFAADAGAWWSAGSLEARDGFAAGGSHSSVEGGLTVGGPTGHDAGEVIFGAEVRSLDTPRQLADRTGELASALATLALDSFGVALRGTPAGVRTDLGSAFLRVDQRLSGGHAVSFRASGATLLSPERHAPTDLGDGGGSARGSDLFASASLASPLNADVGLELRATFESSTRRYDAGDSLAALPLTRVISGALGFGGHEAFPGRFARTSGGGQAVAHIRAGSHLFKAGGGGETVHHDRAFAPGAAGEFTFSDVDDFAGGRGVFTQTVGAAPAASFNVPRFFGFAQDTWTPAPGVEVVLGARYDMEKIPASRIVLDHAWAIRSGLLTPDVRATSSRIAPRGSLTIASAGGGWRLRAEGGVYTGESDAGVLAEAVGGSEAMRVRSGLDVPWSWGAAPDAALVPRSARTLTMLAAQWGPPRATRASGTLSAALGASTTLHLSGDWRKTDFLPRRSDLNLFAEPVGTDGDGRPLFGTLVQRGSVVVADPGSNRRFLEFDRVNAIDLDGWLQWTAATVSLERRPSTGLRLLASYTFSRTRDNLVSADGVAPGGIPAPFLAAGTDWSEGLSSWDTPHRGVVLAELRGGGARTPSLAVVYRVRSGDPFTPGYRAGVDINGDGWTGNDPAFVDAAVSGFGPLASRWGCLAAQQGRFAERNACRGPTVHALDARAAIDLLRRAGHGARLTIDGLNLLGGERGPVDAALYLVDASRALSTDGQGRVVVPLVANPGFGEPLLRRATGRTVRIGLQLAY